MKRRTFKRPPKSKKCGKSQFRDEISAKIAMAKIAVKSTELKIPTRAYRCPMCHYWHLTSQELKERDSSGSDG